jgi:hypothetical protein
MKQDKTNPGNGLRSLIDGALAKVAQKAAASGITNATRVSLSGVIGAAQSNTYDAPSYTPLTTGNALLIVNASSTVSNAGDGVTLQPRLAGAPIAGVAGNANATGGTGADGSFSVVIPIVAGVPIVPGAVITNNTGGHTVSTAAGGLQVTVIELQT